MILQQQQEFIWDLPAEAYSTPSRAGASIGQHIRHSTDHFSRALRLRSQAQGAVCQYDMRSRGTELEHNRNTATRVLMELSAGLQQVEASSLNRGVLVSFVLTRGGEETVLQSTIARELAFCAHHAVHHNYVMRLIADELGIAASVCSTFGFAPSTPLDG